MGLENKDKTQGIPNIEDVSPKETVFTLVSPVVISGNPGTGTSTIVDRLAFLYHLQNDKKINVGNLFRSSSLQQTGEDIIGFYERPKEEDSTIDDLQKALLINPNNEVFILESRLGGFLVSKLREAYSTQGIVLPRTTTVLLTAEDNVRYQRVFSRNQQKDPILSYERAVDDTRQREKGDLLQWRRVHPDLANIDPLSITSAEMYDIHVDTTTLGPNEIVQNLHTRLLELMIAMPE